MYLHTWEGGSKRNLPLIFNGIDIGGQRGGAAVPRPPPPFHKNWSEKATKRVNFSKFSSSGRMFPPFPPPERLRGGEIFAGALRPNFPSEQNPVSAIVCSHTIHVIATL